MRSGVGWDAAVRRVSRAEGWCLIALLLNSNEIFIARLTGKIAAVTDCSRGIGMEIARRRVAEKSAAMGGVVLGVWVRSAGVAGTVSGVWGWEWLVDSKPASFVAAACC